MGVWNHWSHSFQTEFYEILMFLRFPSWPNAGGKGPSREASGSLLLVLLHQLCFYMFTWCVYHVPSIIMLANKSPLLRSSNWDPRNKVTHLSSHWSPVSECPLMLLGWFVKRPKWAEFHSPSLRDRVKEDLACPSEGLPRLGFHWWDQSILTFVSWSASTYTKESSLFLYVHWLLL